MKPEYKSFLLHLIRLGVGVESEAALPEGIDWTALLDLADGQGLAAVCTDGISMLPPGFGPQKFEMMEWIGLALQDEDKYSNQWRAMNRMASLFHQNAIRTYVLKGVVVAECYPKPERRASADMDCFLLPDCGVFDSWALGNDLIKAAGFEVDSDYYKNSTFWLKDLMVESHRFLIPFRGNDRLAALEKRLQAMLRQDGGEDCFEGTWLYRPPVMMSAVFLIEHAYSHFLHEGLNWRHVLDWMLFSRRHRDEIDWPGLDAMIDEFGFRKFYDSYFKLGRYLLGELGEDDLSQNDRRMLDDIWAPLDVHEDVHGLGGKLALAGNTWRARWKYRLFTDITWLQALWIQVRGVLFDKNPKI
ncbi:MAG: nucleotidyltransferase family protein [Bacteroidales bacterium]|nr:nucleotidyltransferase family protein [Bacteroidales bacterium]